MSPNTEKQDAKLVHGMRGAISAERMKEIHSGLPHSITLRDLLPYLANPLAALNRPLMKVQGQFRLSCGWHMLNQARIALVEAEACTVFYEEYRRNHTEAIYRCLYYLDDAALRLHSSCEHMLRAIILHWTLAVPRKDPSVDTVISSKEPRESRSLLTRVQKAAEQSKHGRQVAKLLRQLGSDKAWKACINHRNDWVHNRLPAIQGIFPNIVFDTMDYEKELPPQVRKHFNQKKGFRMSVGTGRDISELRGTVRNAYVGLFQVYEELAKLLASDSENTMTVKTPV